MGLREATLKNSFGFCGLVYPVTFGERVGSSEFGKRTTVGSGGFFVCKARDYDETGIITRRYLQKSRQQITFEQPSYMRKAKMQSSIIISIILLILLLFFIMANKEKERKLKSLIFGNRKNTN